MVHNRCFRQNLEHLFLSVEAIRESIVLCILLLASFILSLPSESFFFFLSQNLIPVSINVVLITGLICGVFLSIRQGLKGSDRESYQGVWIWLHNEKLEFSRVWIGMIVSALIRVLYNTLLLSPFIIMAGSLSGIHISVVFIILAFLFLVFLFFNVAGIFFSILSGGRSFIPVFFIVLLLVMVFFASLLSNLPVNPLVIMLSLRDEVFTVPGTIPERIFDFSAVYGAGCFLLAGLSGLLIYREGRKTQ